MLIDENKIRKTAKSKSFGPMGVLPTAPEKRKKYANANIEKRRRKFEIARMIIGIFLTIAALVSVGALLMTLYEEAMSFVERKSAEPKTIQRAEVIFTPKGMKAVPDASGNLHLEKKTEK